MPPFGLLWFALSGYNPAISHAQIGLIDFSGPVLANKVQSCSLLSLHYQCALQNFAFLFAEAHLPPSLSFSFFQLCTGSTNRNEKKNHSFIHCRMKLPSVEFQTELQSCLIMFPWKWSILAKFLQNTIKQMTGHCTGTKAVKCLCCLNATVVWVTGEKQAMYNQLSF